MTTTQTQHKVVSRDEWLKARLAHLAAEKEFTRKRDELSRQRRELPWERVEKSYVFEGPDGRRTLGDLFEGRRQLIVYHFMFDATWDEGCKSCSFVADQFAGSLVHLAARETSLAAISRAPIAKIERFKQRMGWDFPWLSSNGSDFNYDFHVTLDESVRPVEYDYRTKAEMIAAKVPNPTKGEEHGLSVFFRVDSDVFHTYSTYARGTESLTDAYALLDRTPYGRQEDFEVSPSGWPQKPTYG
jgi:predicted dithiol-disulfide oxidoreductase (DUF899 family)